MRVLGFLDTAIDDKHPLLRVLYAGAAAALLYGTYWASHEVSYALTLHFYTWPQYYLPPVPFLFFLVAGAFGTGIVGQWIAAYRGIQIALALWLVCPHSLALAYPEYVAAAAVIMFLGEIIIRRRFASPKYYTDEHGERQRVITVNRGHPLYYPQTRKQRIVDEGFERKKRRGNLFGYSIFTGLSALGAYLVWGWTTPLTAAFADLFLIPSALAGLCYVLVLGVIEVVYLSGYQGMTGAKVLDPEAPLHPGLRDVQGQNVHGDARLATESESVDLLNAR